MRLAWLFLFAATLAQGHALAVDNDRSRTPLSQVDLRSLPDPGALIGAYVPISKWRNVNWTHGLPGTSSQGIAERSRALLDPRVKPFLVSDVLGKAQEFAISIWPDLIVGGASQPVWLMGFRYDLPGQAETAFHFLLEEFRSHGPPPATRSLSGIRVHTIHVSAKDFHLATVGPTLLVSTNLRVLQTFLSVHEREVLPLPPVESPASIEWRLDGLETDRPSELTVVKNILWNLGVRVVRVSCDLLSPGYRYRVAFLGEFEVDRVVVPPEFDLELIDDVPSNSDFILVGGKTQRKSQLFLESLPPIPDLPEGDLPESFAVGIEIPGGTETTRERIRVAGAYEKAPPPIPLELIPEHLLSATDDLAGMQRRSTRLGDLELALVDREDRTAFRNTLELRPDPRIHSHLQALISDRMEDIPPSYVGILSPNLLARPLDLEWRRLHEEPSYPLLDLWPVLRSLLQPVDFLVFQGPRGGIEIELRSHSLFAPILALLQSGNLLRILREGDMETLNRWLGYFGPLPNSASSGG